MDDRALDQFLNDLTDGRDNGLHHDVDQGLAHAMVQLRALGQVPLSAPAQQRIDRQVEAAISYLHNQGKDPAMTDTANLTTTLPGFTLNGHVAERRPRPARVTRSPRLWRCPPALAWLATVALLLVTIGLGSRSFGPFSSGSQHPSTVPAVFAQGGTPTSSTDVQFAMTLPAPVLPAGPLFLWSTMYQIEAGAGVEYPGFAIPDPAAAIVWVQSGKLAIGGDTVLVHRASMDPSSTSPVAGEQLLGPDDAVAVELGPGHSYTIRSVGTEPLVFAEFWIVGGPEPHYPYPAGYNILDYFHMPDAEGLPLPATVTMQLARMTLAPKGALVPEDGDWQVVLTDGLHATSLYRAWPSGEVRSYADQPIPIFVMTATFTPVTATPSAATPQE